MTMFLAGTPKVIVPLCPACGDWDEPRLRVTTLLVSIIEREVAAGKKAVVQPLRYTCQRPGGGTHTIEIVVWKGDRPRAIQLEASPFARDELYWLQEWELRWLAHPHPPPDIRLVKPGE